MRITEKLDDTTRAAIIATARAKYANPSSDDIEVDDNATLSPNEEEEGCWVAAWVWVRQSEIAKRERTYAYTPDRCPSNHWNDGDDICADCGVPLNAEEPRRFRNHYLCPACGTPWIDEWSAMCDDTCPACGEKAITPHHSDDITGEGDGE